MPGTGIYDNFVTPPRHYATLLKHALAKDMSPTSF
jgi:hypothetical protein